MENFNNYAMCWGVENMMAFRLAQYKAMEECGRSGLASSMVKPTNPFTTLPGNLNNSPFADQQDPLNRLFNNDNNNDNDNNNNNNDSSNNNNSSNDNNNNNNKS